MLRMGGGWSWHKIAPNGSLRIGSVNPSNSGAKVCVISKSTKNIADQIIYKIRSESDKTSLYISSENR
jgi:hypothetical protein